MNKSKPLVSYVVPAYIDEESLEKCLDSINSQNYPRKEVIVVNDNGAESIKELIDDKFPKVKLISLPNNYGHAEASNIGFETAKGEYVAFLDDDSTLEENWTEKLVNKFQTSNKKVGVLEPKLIDQRDGEITNIRYSKEEELTKFTSAGVLAKKEALKEAGYYDEDFFIYKDDYDLAANILKSDYKILAFPEATTYHSYDPNIKPSSFEFFYATRNQLWFYWKHYDRYSALKFSAHKLLRSGVKSIFYGYKKEFAVAYISSFRNFWKYLIKENSELEELEKPSWSLLESLKSLKKLIKGDTTLQEKEKEE